MSEANILVVYQMETDGEMLIDTMTFAELEDFIKDKNLTPDSYAVFRGSILKTFNDPDIGQSLT